MRRENITLCAAAFVALVTPAAANSDLDKCTRIKEDKARLACFDRIAKTKGAVTDRNDPSRTKSSKKSDEAWRENWVRREYVSEFDDKTNVTLRASATNSFQSRFKNGRITLVIRCLENTTSLYFDFDGLFMSDLNHGRVEYRIDKNKPASRRFRVSNDHEALGLWNGARSIPFVKQMFGAEKLVIRATPHSESAVTSEFKIGGLETAIEPLRKACNW